MRAAFCESRQPHMPSCHRRQGSFSAGVRKPLLDVQAFAQNGKSLGFDALSERARDGEGRSCTFFKKQIPELRILADLLMAWCQSWLCAAVLAQYRARLAIVCGVHAARSPNRGFSITQCIRSMHPVHLYVYMYI